MKVQAEQIDPDLQSEPSGMIARVWRSRHADISRYEPFPGATSIIECRASIGWSFAVDPDHGVVLENVWGMRLTADEILEHAPVAKYGLRFLDITFLGSSRPGDFASQEFTRG